MRVWDNPAESASRVLDMLTVTIRTNFNNPFVMVTQVCP